MDWPISWNDVKNAMPIVFRAEDALYKEGTSTFYYVDKNLCDYISAGNIPLTFLSYVDGDDTRIELLNKLVRHAIGANNHKWLVMVDNKAAFIVYLFESNEAAFEYYDR